MKFSLLLSALCALPSAFAAYDQNRAGAVLKAPEGDSFKSVTGTFSVPNLSGTARLSIWVAIGESTEQDYVLKGGIHYNRGYASFAGWYPDAETNTTTSVPAKASDSITVTVALTSATSGTVTIENKTQNKKVTQTVAAPASVDPSYLTARTADWFVQAYQVVPGELVNAPRFGTIAFTACSATLASGASRGPTGAGTFEIQGTSGQIYSKTTVSSSGVSVQRSG